MDDVVTMRVVERRRDFASDAQCLLERERATRKASRERFPLEMLHDEEANAAFVPNVVKRADMGVRQLRDGARLAVEPSLEIRRRPQV
jgi:hypothetical protein